MTSESLSKDLVAWIRERCFSLNDPPRLGANVIAERDKMIACGDELERLAMEFDVASRQAAELRDEVARLRSDAERYRWLASHPDDAASAVADAYASWIPNENLWDVEETLWAEALAQEIEYQQKRQAAQAAKAEGVP